jgi:hypothetical protein
MKKIALVVMLVAAQTVFSQDELLEPVSKANFGLGVGLDYGGIGGRLTYLPAPVVGLFAGLGYNFAGLGYNLGGVIRLAPDKRVVPALYAMYGYNAALKITGSTQVNKSYYGPSFGLGMEIKGRNNNQNHFNLKLLLPLRPDEFQNDINAYQSIGVDITAPPPVAFSIGYHFSF